MLLDIVARKTSTHVQDDPKIAHSSVLCNSGKNWKQQRELSIGE